MVQPISRSAPVSLNRLVTILLTWTLSGGFEQGIDCSLLEKLSHRPPPPRWMQPDRRTCCLRMVHVATSWAPRQEAHSKCCNRDDRHQGLRDCARPRDRL